MKMSNEIRPHLRGGKWCTKDMPEDAAWALYMWMTEHSEEWAPVLEPFGLTPSHVPYPEFQVVCTQEHSEESETKELQVRVDAARAAGNGGTVYIPDDWTIDKDGKVLRSTHD